MASLTGIDNTGEFGRRTSNSGRTSSGSRSSGSKSSRFGMAEFDDNTSPDDDLNGVAIGMEENDGSPTSDGGSSSGWSDEEGDEYLAKALASDAYLRGVVAVVLPQA